MLATRPGLQTFSGRQKAAILLIGMGPDFAAQVFKHMTESQVEMLSLEIARQRNVYPEESERVIEEFLGMALAKTYASHGGLEYARDILEKAMGQERARDFIQRVMQSMQVRPFEFISKADPSQMLTFLQNEHPQTIALIMAYMPPERAAAILSALPSELQSDVARRIAIMDRTSPEVLKEVERVLERQLSSLMRDDFTSAGGVEAVVEVLNRADRTTERTIMESLIKQDPNLAEEIKKRMFLFEDIVFLDDRALQRVVREIDLGKDLPLALKVGSEDVKRKIFANISRRMSENLKEAMDYLGPVRLRDVEEAQARIVNVIRRLEEAGEIELGRGGGEVIVG